MGQGIGREKLTNIRDWEIDCPVAARETSEMESPSPVSSVLRSVIILV